MSEKILKALLQIFAIIARPEAEKGDEGAIVKSFLIEQLSSELAPQYVEIFNAFYAVNQTRFKEATSVNKIITAKSVRLLRLCNEINEELTQKQKIIILFHLFEFIKSNKNVGEQEIEFVNSVAEAFNISTDETLNLRGFVLGELDSLNTSELLIINNKGTTQKNSVVRHLLSVALEGQIGILHINSTNLYIIKYEGDDTLFINGHLLTPNKVRVLNNGSSIKNSKIIPIYFSDIVSKFHEMGVKTKLFIEANGLTYKFKNGNMGFHKLDLLEKSGKLVGIMGVSGSGKTTFINVLNGTLPPSSGEILINGISLQKEKEKLQGVIGYVSQDDFLFEELTVFQNLYYNAKLCFSTYSKFQILRVVLRVLKNVGLYEVRKMKVGSPMNKKISGGQRKRLNIAMELIREPVILFLDEPTSGLSSRDSENILDLLKELSLKGKIVFVVIHQPSSDIFKMFDKLLIFDQGGYLIYNGDPVDSITYFKSLMQQANWSESECAVCGNVNPEQIFNIVEAQIIDEYGDSTHKRRKTPEMWYRHLIEHYNNTSRRSYYVRALPELSFHPPKWWKQLGVFVTRDVLSKLSNMQYLLISFLEAPILAFILTYLFKYYDVDPSNTTGYLFINNSNLTVYLFMSVIVGLFVGLTGSAQEIFKDRKILKREQFLNLSRTSYLFSKMIILFGIAAVQALMYVLVGNWIIEMKGMLWEMWLVLFSIWSFAILLGLNISDGFRSSVTIYIVIPFLIIPQIILSGVIVSFDKLNPTVSSPGKIPFFGEAITSRWAYEALAVNQFTNNEYSKWIYTYEKIINIANYKHSVWIKELESRLMRCYIHLHSQDKKKNVHTELLLLRNELRNEAIYFDKPEFEFINDLYQHKMNINVLNSLKEYLNTLKDDYVRRETLVRGKVDKKMMELTSKGIDMNKLKTAHFNQNLYDFVLNRSDVTKVVEYEGYLYKRIEPIYTDPLSPMIKAHFYAPRKMVFGKYYSTYTVNIIVIWLHTFLMYIALHFRWLKRTFDYFEYLVTKRRIRNGRK